MSRIIFYILLLVGVLNADYISNFNSDKTTVSPDEVVNLTLTFVVTKKYELHFTAYNNNTGAELSPGFTASSLNDIQYTVPSDADYEIKIVAQLVEDGSVVDSKEVILSANTVDQGLYFCSIYTSTFSGVNKHSTISQCFNPQPYVEYLLIYGDDPGAAIFLEGTDIRFHYNGISYNTAVMGNAIIHYYYITNITFGLGGSCYSGCCSYTTWGTDSNRQCLNSGDTEDKIFATYQPDYNRIKIRFTGGYYNCSCSAVNCCGEYRTNIGYIYYW